MVYHVGAYNYYYHQMYIFFLQNSVYDSLKTVEFEFVMPIFIFLWKELKIIDNKLKII